MRDLFIRLGLVMLVITLYFLALRPVRSQLHQHTFAPLVEHSVPAGHPSISYEQGSSVTSNIFWDKPELVNTLVLTFPFGLHFLLAAVGLIFLRSGRRFWVALVIIQAGGAVVSLITFYLAAQLGTGLLVLTDLTGSYLVPLCSLGVVPLAFIYRKKENTFHEKDT